MPQEIGKGYQGQSFSDRPGSFWRNLKQILSYATQYTETVDNFLRTL